MLRISTNVELPHPYMSILRSIAWLAVGLHRKAVRDAAVLGHQNGAHQVLNLR